MKSNLKKRWLKTKMGVFLLEMSVKGLYSVQFPGIRKNGRMCHSRASGNPGSGSPIKAFGDDRSTVSSFSAYFKDPVAKVDLKMDLTGYTPFQLKVYAALRKVPAGKTVTYGELAKRAGYPGAARAVGTAMKKNRLPIVIPCHRVVPKDGTVGRYSQGTLWKKRLLEYEGFVCAMHNVQRSTKRCALRVGRCAIERNVSRSPFPVSVL